MKNDSFTKNVIFNVIKSCSQILFPLITVPYISRVLLTENVGKVNFGNSIVSYFSLIASLGVYGYAVRECSRVKDDKNKLAHTSSQIMSINILMTLISYLILFFALNFIMPLQNYRLLISIQSTVILFTTIGADWLNTALEDFKYMTIRTVFFQGISLCMMFLFVRKPDDYLKYAFISVLASSGANILNVYYRRRYCKMVFTIHMNVKKHMPYIMTLFAMVLSQTVYCNSDITILGFVRGDYEVGLYSISVKIYNIVKSLITSIMWVIIPKMSYLYQKNDYLEINNTLKSAINFLVSLALPCIIGLNLIAPEIIQVLAGKEYLDAVLSLHILTIALIFALLGGFFGNVILIPSLKEKIFLKICILSALVNIITNFVFIPLFGLNAAASTTVLSEAIVFIGAYLNTEKEIKISNIKDIIIGPVIGLIGIFIVFLICRALITNIWNRVLAIIIFSIIVYFVILVRLKNEIAITLYKDLKQKFLMK